MRTVKKYPFSLTEDSKAQLLQWVQQFDEVVWMDSNNYSQNHKTYQAILAVDAFTAIKTDAHNAFDKLKDYQIGDKEVFNKIKIKIGDEYGKICKTVVKKTNAK